MVSSNIHTIAEEIYSAHRSTKYPERSLSLDERDILDSEGLEVLSFGIGRIVCVHPKDSSKLVKFARNVPSDASSSAGVADGVAQNKAEAYLWEKASQKHRSFLGTVRDYSSDYLVLIMDRYDRPRNAEEGVSRLREELGDISGLPIHEIRSENIAAAGSGYVLIDYGSYEIK